jgi:hypothetical protein
MELTRLTVTDAQRKSVTLAYCQENLYTRESASLLCGHRVSEHLRRLFPREHALKFRLGVF